MAIVPGNAGTAATFPDGFQISDGTVTAPTLKFSDSQTGFYKPGTNQIALSTAGVQRWIVDASGVMTIAGTLTISAGSAANLSIWAASNVLRMRGGTSGWAVDNTSGTAILSALDSGAFTIGPASMATSLYQTVNGSIVGRATASQTQGIFAGGTIARLNANSYFDAAGNTERAITTQTGYASLLINSSSTSTDVAMRLLTNHTNAQTANSAIVTTNQLTVFEVTQAGAVTWGASGSASSSSQAHVVNGGINAGATGTGDAFRRAMINANAYTFGDAWGSARNSNSNTLGGCFLEVSARTSDSSECLRVYANRIADGNTTNPTLIMYGTQAGAFAFGPTTETVTNVSKGRFTATWNDNSNASSAALESYRKSSTATHYMMVMYSDVGSTGALKWRAEADGDTISATGSYTSDARAKKNLSPIQYGLNEILQLAPKSFNWWYEDDSETPNFCASTAQEIEMLMPELVRDDGLSGPNGIQMKAVYEKELVPVLIKAMQELHAELQIAKERITILEGGQ